MGHQKRHRGAHPQDETLFSESQLPGLRLALRDYGWLLSQGYAVPSSLKLVGDKFQLTDRQRLLLMRSACSQVQREQRSTSMSSPQSLVDQDLYLDGFNVLITIESALSGGFVFVGLDGCYRDLSSVHGTYKRVNETQEAIVLIGNTLQDLQIRRTVWFLDQPVSNSGMLRKRLSEVASQYGWDWTIELCQSPDHELKKIDGTIVSTDSVILDSVASWFHLNRSVIDEHIPDARLVDLRQD